MNITFQLMGGLVQFGTAAAFVVCHIAYGGYYWILYVPFIAARAALWFLVGLHDRDVTGFALFSYGNAQATALYLQGCVWQIFLVALLVVRPIYFWRVVSGIENSPCGRSSCSRSTDPLENADGNSVYNPHGWFPTGEYNRYDPTGRETYVFCDFANCRWAANNIQENRKFERFDMPQCTPNYDRPVDLELIARCNNATNAFEAANPETCEDAKNVPVMMSQRLEDYPNLGLGWKGGFSCAMTNEAKECPGTVVTDPVTSQPTNGRRVCSVCGQYKNTYKSVLFTDDENTFQTEGNPNRALPTDVQWSDPDTHCAPKADNSVHVLCPFICPSMAESTTPRALSVIITLNAALVAEAVFCIVVIMRGASVSAGRRGVGEPSLGAPEEAPAGAEGMMEDELSSPLRTTVTRRKRRSKVFLV